MRPVLLDTSVLLGLVRESPEAERACAAAGVHGPSARGYIPWICAGELLSIRQRAEWSARKRQEHGRFFKKFAMVEEVTPDILRSYALIESWTLGAPVESPTGAPPPKPSRPLGRNDLRIAAVAHGMGAALLTADRDFLPFDGIWFPVLHCRLQSERSGRADRP